MNLDFLETEIRAVLHRHVQVWSVELSAVEELARDLVGGVKVKLAEQVNDSLDRMKKKVNDAIEREREVVA